MWWLNCHLLRETIPKTFRAIVPTAKKATDIGLLCQDRDEITTFPKLENLMNPTSGTPTKTATIRGITPKLASQKIPKTANETEVPVPSVAKNINANIVAAPTFPAVSGKYVSIVAKLAISGTNAVPDAKT